MNLSKGTLLVVDGDIRSLKLLTTILTEEGYDVRPTDSGALALASAVADPPELMLLDIRLPDIDGREVLRRLKAGEETRDFPIIFISGSAKAEEQVEGLTLGAVDFVVKPFRRAELLARVRTHLELGRLRKQLKLQLTHVRRNSRTLSINWLSEVAARKRTELTLHESEKRFRKFADTAPVMIWVSGTDKKCVFANEVWLSFTGRTLDQELGDGWMASVHPDDFHRCLASFGPAFDAQQSFKIEYRLRRADGEYRWVLGNGVPRFEEDGTFAGYVGSCIDITDLKKSQEEALAKQKWESLAVMASGIAHDLGNLLGGILAESTLLLSSLPIGSPAREGIESVRAISVRASEIVGALMAYAGHEEREFEPVDLCRLVSEMLQLLRFTISKRAKVELNLPENLPVIRANASQLRRVVMNLITNASEALGEREGLISVSVAHVQSDSVSTTDTAPESSRADCLRLEVRDTGCGISEEAQSRIFDPFFTTKMGGRGLGLSVVQGIIRNHGGSLTVNSVPGHGCRLEILLPCGKEPTPSPSAARSSTAAEEGGMGVGTVLIVEDEGSLRLAASKMLAARGFSVLEARNGRLGLGLFRENAKDIDVVLLDLILPDLLGQEILQELRRIRPDVKVIVMTGYTRDYALASLGGQQSWLYLRKPFHITELMELLGRAAKAGE